MADGYLKLSYTDISLNFHRLFTLSKGSIIYILGGLGATDVFEKGDDYDYWDVFLCINFGVGSNIKLSDNIFINAEFSVK